MKTSFKLAAVAAACALTSLAQAQVAFDANYENDTTYKSAQGTKASALTNGGRLELNASAMKKNGDAFIQAKGTLLVKQNTNAASAVGTDDAWIKLGTSAFDVQLGAFEAADLFPMGKDTVVEGAGVAGVGYKGGTLRGRGTTSTASPMHAVVGVNAGAARIELGAFTQSSTATAAEVYGLRPTVVFGLGALTLRAGVEAIKTNTNGVADQTGVGLSVGYALSASSALNANYAKNNDAKVSSLGLNVTFGDLGLGVVQDRNDNNNDQQTSFYAAYSMPLMGIKGASVTPAFSTSSGTGVETVNAVRVRLNYSF